MSGVVIYGRFRWFVLWSFRDVVGESKMSVSQMERELGQMGVEFDDDGQVSSVVI